MSTYGWSGKILRVDLSTGRIWTEKTMDKYRDYLGATGIGYKVMWDEVPAGVKAFDPENRIIFGGGPLIGSGSPCGGRVAITSLFPTSYPVEVVGSGHMGGHWGAELKFAGWDAVIIQGKAAGPVWLAIHDDKVEIRDARQLWGNGIYRATIEICGAMGAEAQVAAIGQAGENLVRMACVITANSHSAGGIGGVMGSKNLKAIGVRGTGSVKIAAKKQEWKALVNHVLSLAGSNNQWVVPSTPQPWAEFHAANSRWTARKGLFWGAANPPVETGTCDPRDRNSIGYRCQKAVFDLGPIAEQFTVKMDGCHSCPIRCHMQISVPSAERFGVSRYASNTCVGWWGRSVIASYPDGPRGMAALEGAVVGKHMSDDYGIWCNYGQISRDFTYAYKKGILKKVLSEKEYKSIPFDLYEKGSPEFIKDFMRRVAYREGEFGFTMGEGTARVAEKWRFESDFYNYEWNVWNAKLGYPKHHSTESGGQVGALINTQYNRDAQCHSHMNFYANGLPLGIQKRLAADAFGSGDAIDAFRNYTPMNVHKAKFAKWSLVRKELHDSLPLCNWMFPWIASPLKSRGYKGDTGIESKLYSAVTGDKKSEAELDLLGERIFNLHRALTIRGMKTKEMRAAHDLVPDWAYDYPKDAKPFTPGHDKMDREDMKKAFDMFYQECGWDTATGAPTGETYRKLGLGFVADELGKLALLP